MKLVSFWLHSSGSDNDSDYDCLPVAVLAVLAELAVLLHGAGSAGAARHTVPHSESGRAAA